MWEVFGSWRKGSSLVIRGTRISSRFPSQCSCVWMCSWEGCSQLVTWELVCRWEACQVSQRGKIETRGRRLVLLTGWLGRHTFCWTRTHIQSHVCICEAKNLVKQLALQFPSTAACIYVQTVPIMEQNLIVPGFRNKSENQPFSSISFTGERKIVECQMLKHFPACHGLSTFKNLEMTLVGSLGGSFG